MELPRKFAHGAVVVAAVVALAGFGSPANAALPAPSSADSGALSGDALAAARAALDAEPQPVVTAEMQALLAAKDAQATAYRAGKMTARGERAGRGAAIEDALPQAMGIQAGQTGGLPLQLCPAGDCSWNAVSANQTPQVNGYYCGPATLVEAVGHRGVPMSQDTAGSALHTTTNGTAWYAGTYPMVDALNRYLGQQGADYAAVNLSRTPNSAEQSRYQAHLVSNIDHGWAIAGDAFEVAGGPHLVGHPNTTVFHWFDIRGYEGWGATTWYEDSVHGASSVGWSGGVPAYSRYNSNTLVVLMGGRGYVW